LVAAALKEKLLPAPAAPAVDPEIARQLQIGRDRVLGTSREDALAAIAAYGKVLALDGSHAEARAGSTAALQTLSRLDAAEAEANAARERAAAAAAQARQREAAEKAQAEARQREIAEKAAAEAQQRQAEARRREAEEKEAAEARQRE